MDNQIIPIVPQEDAAVFVLQFAVKVMLAAGVLSRRLGRGAQVELRHCNICWLARVPSLYLSVARHVLELGLTMTAPVRQAPPVSMFCHMVEDRGGRAQLIPAAPWRHGVRCTARTNTTVPSTIHGFPPLPTKGPLCGLDHHPILPRLTVMPREDQTRTHRRLTSF